MKKIAIISPSGKFYGSEQVLFDFLSITQYLYHVYIPKGEFYTRLKEQDTHYLHRYSSVKFLYIRLLFLLLLNKYDGIYINEGGHIKYLNILAQLFPNRHFFVHIRLLEDTSIKRLGKSHNNITYISISKYIQDAIFQNAHITSEIIYDIYKSNSGFDRICNLKLIDNVCRLGIVGRVTPTKGLKNISRFCDFCNSYKTPILLELHFYGDIDNHSFEVNDFILRAQTYKNIKCIFHGFVKDKNQIYQSIDILAHFNATEPLGRILMEALDFGIPFIGFKSGGVGEMAYQFGVEDYMIPYENNWELSWQNKITDMVIHADKTIEDYYIAKKKMKEICSPNNYIHALEKLFYE